MALFSPSSRQPAPGMAFLLPLVLVTASGPTAMQMILPALPAIGASFAVGPAQTHMLVSLALLTFGCAMLVWGPLSDRLGRRWPLVAGSALFALGSALCVFAPSMPVMLAGRVIAALGSSAGLVLTRAMVRDIYPPHQVASAISQLTIGQLVPPLMAPAFGGILTDLAGWRANFMVLLAIGIANVLLTWRLAETRPPRLSSGPAGGSGQGHSGLLAAAAGLLRNHRFAGVTGLGAGLVGAWFAFVAGAPAIAIDHFGLSPSQYGLSFISLSAAAIAGNLLSARLSPRLGVDRMMAAGCFLAVVATVGGMFLSISGMLTAWLLFVPGILLMLGNGLALASSQTAAMSVDPRTAGAAAGLTGFFQMVAGAAVAQSAGLIHDGSAVPLMAMMLVAVAAGTTLYATLGRQSRPVNRL